MKQHTLQWLDRLGPRTLRGGVLALTAVVALALPVVAAVLHARRGPDGVYAAAVAAGLCWLATVTALVVTKIATDRQARLAGVFGAMLLRTGVPLAGAVVLVASSPALARGGVFGATVIFYLLTLAVETASSVRMINSTNDVSRVA